MSIADDHPAPTSGAVSPHPGDHCADLHRISSGRFAGAVSGDGDYVRLDDLRKVVFHSIVQALLDLVDQLILDDLKLGVVSPCLNGDADQQGKSDQKSYTLEFQLLHDAKLDA